MAPSPDSPRTSSKPDDPAELAQFVKDYVRQETVEPLKGWGRYVAYGTAGAVVVGFGLALCLLGLLRLLQTETDAFDGPNSSILAYVITLVACLVVVGLAVFQIRRRTTLQRKEPS